MTEPIWLELAAVRLIHHDQLDAFGGLDGVRDLGMLESALARPRHVWAYSSEAPDLARLAAAYAFGLTRNHPFVDGNKRTALVACHTFLRGNGWRLLALQSEQVQIFLRLASGDIDEDELSAWIRERIVPASS